MTKFFGRHSRSRRTEVQVKDNGLSDKTNFPLLSSKWMGGPELVRASDSTTNFSARRLLRISDPRRITQTTSPTKPDPKAASPPHDVASAWVGMGSDTTAYAKPASLTRLSSQSRQPRAMVTTYSTERNTTRQGSAPRSRNYNTSTSTASSSSTSLQQQRSSRYASHSTSRSKTSMRKAKQPHNNSAQQVEWRSAVDPKSGRTYYYNVRTRETQWRKPMELASPEERKEMVDKERKQKDFFAAMEANILKQMATGQVPGTPRASPNTPDVTMAEAKKEPARPHKPMLEKPRMVRTISGMDDQILKQLVKRVPSLRTSKMNRDNSSMSMETLGKLHDEGHLSNISEESMNISMNMSAMEISLADLNYDMDGDSPSAREENRALMQLAKTAEEMRMASGSVKGSPPEPVKPKSLPSTALKRPSLDSRRNTCGTIYVGSTMSAPDKDATIKVRLPGAICCSLISDKLSRQL